MEILMFQSTAVYLKKWMVELLLRSNLNPFWERGTHSDTQTQIEFFISSLFTHYPGKGGFK